MKIFMQWRQFDKGNIDQKNSFKKKSATTSRAWPRPLRGAIPIPPALLVVADFFGFETLPCVKSKGNRGIQITSGDMADCKCHSQL
jgi:hypothetical protein